MQALDIHAQTRQRFAVEAAMLVPHVSCITWVLVAWLLCSSFSQNISHCVAAEDDLPSLNTAVWFASKRIEGWLREHNHASAAVLKFDSYVQGERDLRDDVGPIHINLARRLERGLIVVQRPKDRAGRPLSEIVIAADANAVAAKTSGADFSSKSGRVALSGADFLPAWGTGPLHPDVFLTGMLRFESNASSRVTLIVLGFARETPDDVVKLGEFPADLAIQDLIDCGRSFSTRGAFDEGVVKLNSPPTPASANNPTTSNAKPAAEIVELTLEELAGDIASSNVTSPLLSPEEPVQLTLLYDGEPQTILNENGELFVPEPKAGQMVEFRIDRQGSGQPRLGVVLKINGENSYGRERGPDHRCTKWILEPKNRSFKIDGFHLNNQLKEPFRVADKNESKRIENQFGSDVGTISISVYRENNAQLLPIASTAMVQGTKSIPQLPIEEDPSDTRPIDLLAIAEGEFPASTSTNRATIQMALRSGKTSSRGLILPSQKVAQQLTPTSFESYPIPILTATVRYYRAAKP